MNCTTTYVNLNGVMDHPIGTKTITGTALMMVLQMFIEVFGRDPLLKHEDFSHREFCAPSDLNTWDLALALQIMLNTLAVSTHEDDRIDRLKQRMFELLGDMNAQQVVYFRGYPFYI